MRNIYLLLLCSFSAMAQLNYSPLKCNALSGADDSQYLFTLSKQHTIQDFDGNFITIFRNDATNHKDDIFAQKTDPNGTLLWGPNGKMVYEVNPNGSTANDDAKDAQITPDGAGGAFISFTMYSNASDNRELYVIRINFDGELSWPQPLKLTQASATDYLASEGDKLHTLLSDGDGSAYIAWPATMIVNNTRLRQVRMQKVAANGITAWTAPVIVDTLTYIDVPSTFYPVEVAMSLTVLPDHSGVVSWLDSDGIFASRIGTDGTLLWGSSGIAVDSGDQSATDFQFYPRMAATTNGMFITYIKDNTLFANYITNAGVLNFDEPFALLADYNKTNSSKVSRYDLVADGETAVILYGSDVLVSNTPTVQKLDALGHALFNDGGIALVDSDCITPWTESRFKIVKSFGGNYIAIWAGVYRIKAQKISTSGTVFYDEPVTLMLSHSNPIFAPHSLNVFADADDGATVIFRGKITIVTSNLNLDVLLAKLKGQDHHHWVCLQNAQTDTYIDFTTTDGIHYTATNVHLESVWACFLYDGQWYGIHDMPSDTATCGYINMSPGYGDYDITFNALTKEYSFATLDTNDVRKAPFTIYPNPVTDALHWDSGKTFDSLIISDLQGKTIMTLRNAASPVMVAALPKGVYLVHAEGTDGSFTAKLVK